MKEILKNVKMNFKLNSTVFILASVIYLFLLVIGLSLTLIFPFSDVLTVIFIISPFIFTFSYLAYKSSEREILEYKDVYKGYCNEGNNAYLHNFIHQRPSLLVRIQLKSIKQKIGCESCQKNKEYYVKNNKLCHNQFSDAFRIAYISKAILTFNTKNFNILSIY